jgi:hypothetical protein
MPGVPPTPDEPSVQDVLAHMSKVRTTRPAHPADGDTWTEVVGNALRIYHCRKVGDRLVISEISVHVG